MTTLKTNKVAGLNGTTAIDGSVFFDGADSYLVCTDNSDFALGTGDFTVEAWFLVSTNLDYRSLIDNRTSVSDDWMIGMRSNDRIYVYAGAFLLESPTGSVTPGHWHHVAYVRSSGTHALYLNGVSVATSSTSKDYDSQKLAISAPPYNAGAEEFKGYVSNVRIVKGTALYTTDFTPSTSKLTAVDGTVLLCCQDSDNPTQEATGKTITAHGGLLQTASELTAGALTSSNYSSAESDWSFSNGVATVSMSSGGYESLGSITNRLVNGQLYELVVNVTTFNAGKITFGQANAGNADFTIALGRNVFRHRYTGNTQDTGGIGLYARDATGGGYAINLLSLKQVISGKAPKVLPPVGIDAGTVLDGGVGYDSLNYMTLPKGTTTQSNRGRGVFMANAVSPTMSNSISYIDIQSSGNTVDFGDLTVTLRYGAGGSSATRGLSGGGVTPSWPANNVIDYFTLATTANAQEFGDLIESGSYGKACLANSTRLLWCGGYSVPDGGNTNAVSYSTIATLGDALNFGDLSDGSSYLRRYLGGGIQSPTRGILVGGYSGSSYTNSMVYISITTLGNSADFGDISYTAAGTPGASSSTRGVIFPGYNGSNYNTNSIEYVTIATLGNAVDFGDTTHTGGYGQAVSNSSRAVMGHGITPSTGTNYMEFVTIATTGNASDFGDMGVHTGDSGNNNNCSDSHGGLG